MNNKLILLLALMATIALSVKAQNDIPRYRLRGRITDGVSGKSVGNFPILVREFNRKVQSNGNGEFLFNMAQGTYTLVLDDYPYKKTTIRIALKSDSVIKIVLAPLNGTRRLEEVQVVAHKITTDKPTGLTQLNAQELKELPAMIGERDVLKALALGAGVSASGEGTADMQVRGATAGHNLYLLDQVPLYSTEHMYGMVSAYNPSVVQSANFYKSAFPAAYGGRLSSVVDIRSKAVDLQKTSGEAEISLLSTKAYLNVPIQKNKLGLAVGGRLSNYSLINLISGFLPDSRMAFHFADINAGLSYQPSDKNNFKISFFHNSDGFYLKEKDGWGTSTGKHNNQQQNLSANWLHRFSNNSSNQLLVYADQYKFGYGSEYEGLTHLKSNYSSTTSIAAIALDETYECRFSVNFAGKAGALLKQYRFSPYSIQNNDSSSINSASTKYLESAAYAQITLQPFKNHTLDAGMRLSGFGDQQTYYLLPEPRLAYQALIRQHLSVSASVSRMNQFIHRIANPGMGIALELFQPSDRYLKPESSWNYSLGIAADKALTNSSQLSVKSEFWYKSMEQLVDFKEGFDAVTVLFSDNKISDDKSKYLTQGKGFAYGWDLSAIYNNQHLKLSADYTLMKARNMFSQLNDGQWFDAATDIRNSLTLAGSCRINSKWTFSANWQFHSGRPITLPTAVFPVADIDLNTAAIVFRHGVQNRDDQAFQTIETSRNNARARAFHKLDIAFNKHYMYRKKYPAQLSLGLYNVYNRANPAYYYIDSKRNTDGSYRPVLKSVSMFPVLPSVSWSVKF